MSWPFDTWGLDVVGPITPKSSTRHAYILAATNYFCKWVEVMPLKGVKKKKYSELHSKEYYLSIWGATIHNH